MTSSMFLMELAEVEHARVAITSVSNKIERSVEVIDDEIIVARYFVSITHYTSLSSTRYGALKQSVSYCTLCIQSTQMEQMMFI